MGGGRFCFSGLRPTHQVRNPESLRMRCTYNMPNAQNKEMLASIKEDLDGVSAMWVVDYRGLTVKEMQQLRRDIRETGSVLKVYKNTLVHLALSEAELPTLDDMLAGPSAFVFSGNDVAASAKALKTFAKANENLEIKGGIMDGAVVCAASSWPRSPVPSPASLVVWPPPSTVCRAVWPRSSRPWPTRRKLPNSSGGLRRAA